MALVGDMDRFNIGQDGYCGKRTEVDQPGKARFRIPSQVETFFFVRTTFRVEHGTYYCEGDYSFTPEPAALHIVRYSFESEQCKLELFRTLPGATPQPFPVKVEQRRSCLRP